MVDVFKAITEQIIEQMAAVKGFTKHRLVTDLNYLNRVCEDIYIYIYIYIYICIHIYNTYNIYMYTYIYV